MTTRMSAVGIPCFRFLCSAIRADRNTPHARSVKKKPESFVG